MIEVGHFSFIVHSQELFRLGTYLSKVGAAATTADRICIRLSERSALEDSELRSIKDLTLGKKLYRLRSMKVISLRQFDLLRKINVIRNRHLHPKKKISLRTLKGDSYRILKYLHDLLEDSFSVFKDFTIEKGRFVPKEYE